MNKRIEKLAEEDPELKEALSELAIGEHPIHKNASKYVNEGNDAVGQAHKDGMRLGEFHAKREEKFDWSLVEEADAVAEFLKENSDGVVKGFKAMIQRKDPKALDPTDMGRTGQMVTKLAYYAGYIQGFMKGR